MGLGMGLGMWVRTMARCLQGGTATNAELFKSNLKELQKLILFYNFIILFIFNSFNFNYFRMLCFVPRLTIGMKMMRETKSH